MSSAAPVHHTNQYRFDNDIAIKSKYYRDLCYLVCMAHILSLQDVTFGVCFVLYFMKLSSWQRFFVSAIKGHFS